MIHERETHVCTKLKDYDNKETGFLSRRELALVSVLSEFLKQRIKLNTIMLPTKGNILDKVTARS
jgi:hypothetical protein